ncbi:hypothetical protein EBT16_00470 [bacterium]|nr:hypothetical protein [bacterium]
MQFSDPDQKVPTEIEMPEETERMAAELVSAGYRFEMQKLPSGVLHMDCSRPGSEGPVSLELCESGFSSEQADRLVREAHSFVFKDEETVRTAIDMVELWDEDENLEEFWK